MAWFRFENQTRLIHKDNTLPFWQLTAFSTLCNKADRSFLSVSIFSLSFFLFLSQLNAKYVIFVASRGSRGWFPGTMIQASCVIQLSFLCFSKGRADSAKTGSLGRLIVQQIPAPQAEPWAHTVTARQPHKIPLNYPTFWLFGENRMLHPSLDPLSVDHRKRLNRWLPENVKFYRFEQSLSPVKFLSFTPKQQQYVRWHFTFSINTGIVGGFQICLWGWSRFVFVSRVI